MKILSVAGCPYEDYRGQVLHLRTDLEEGEVVNLGDTISIEMMDDSFMDAEVKLINPKYAGDLSWITKYAAEKVMSGEYGMSEQRVMKVEGPCIADLIVLDVPGHEVKTDENIDAREFFDEMSKMICLSPYKEINGGSESIYDHVQEGYTVPNQVIAYLRTTELYFMCPGIYEHPFKPGQRLLGPYAYTDGKYYWDRDTWKYVLKYHVTLPQEFVDYAMSDEGAAYIENFLKESGSWSDKIQDWKKEEGYLCLLPDDEGDVKLEDF